MGDDEGVIREIEYIMCHMFCLCFGFGVVDMSLWLDMDTMVHETGQVYMHYHVYRCIFSFVVQP